RALRAPAVASAGAPPMSGRAALRRDERVEEVLAVELEQLGHARRETRGGVGGGVALDLVHAASRHRDRWGRRIAAPRAACASVSLTPWRRRSSRPASNASSGVRMRLRGAAVVMTPPAGGLRRRR